MILLNILVFLLFLVTAFTVLYSFIFSMAGVFAVKKQYSSGDTFKKIAVFIPCHKQDESILRSAEHALFQKYPSHRYDVVIIVDSLQQETVEKLKKLPIKFIEAHYDISNKAIALQTAFSKLTDQYDIAVILDADSFMKPDFLEKINAAFLNGCYAVQGHRIARNNESKTNILESVCNEINNHIFRKGQQAFGFSSTVTESCIAFSYFYLKLVVDEMEMKDGFNRELELKLVEDNHRIVYIEDALVIDEKIQRPEGFTHKRSAWISSQFTYFKHNCIRGILSLFFGKFDYANKIAHFALVPKVILFTFLVLMTTVSWFIHPMLFIGFNVWAILTGLYVFALVIAIPFSYYRLNTAYALASLPWNFLLIFRELFSHKIVSHSILKPSITQFNNQSVEK